MTLTSELVLVQYSGDGSTTSFPITYVFWDDNDFEVILTDAVGTDTTWTRGTEYTILQPGGPGTTGTLVVEVGPPIDYTPASGTRLTIKSSLANTQPSALPLGGSLPSDKIELQLDQIVRQGQQREEAIDRSLKFPLADPTSLTSEIPKQIIRKTKLQGYDDSGVPIVSDSTVDEVDAIVATGLQTGQTMQQFTFLGDATTTDFTMSGIVVPSRFALEVFISGIAQDANDFSIDTTTVAGSTIVKFNTAPPNQTKIRVHVIGFSKPFSSGDASTVSFTQSGVGAIVRTAEGRLREIISVLDFIPVAEHTAIQAGTSTYDASTDIQAALDAAAGKTTYFSPGTYISESELTPPSNTTIFAYPNTATLTKQTGGTHDLITLSSVDNISVMGLKLDGKRSAGGGVAGNSLGASSVDNLLIDGCWFLDGININFEQNVTNARIVNNVISDGFYGIAIGTVNPFGACTDIIIANNFIEGMNTEGIDVNQNAQRVTIQGNVFFNNHSDSGIGEVIDVGGDTTAVCTDISIVGNVVDNNGKTAQGILIKQNTDRVLIANNVLRNADTLNTDGRGIRFSRSTHGVISGNHIDGFYRGLAVDTDAKDVVVSNNTIENVTILGITIATNVNERIVVTNNVVIGTGATGDGIKFADVTDYEVSNNVVTDFDGEGINLTSTANRGICSSNNIQLCSDGIIVAAPNTTVVGNQSHNNKSRGIAVSADHVIVTGNEAFDNNTAGAQYGITLETGADFCIVNNNKCYDTRVGGARTQDGGFRVVGACDRCVVQGNIFFNNITTQITGTSNLTNSVYVSTDNVIS